LGLEEGLTDAVTYSSAYAGADIKWWQFVVNNNIRHNMDAFDGGDLKFHFMFGGYNVSKNVDYWIWSKGLSDGERIDMGMETILTLSSIPDFDISWSTGKTRKAPTRWFNGCKRGGNRIAGCTPQTFTMLNYTWHKELTIFKDFVFPLWFSYYGR